MSRGIVLFAMNNSKIDYVDLAVLCSTFIRKNMPGIPITLITDKASRDWHDSKGRWPLEQKFDTIILTDVENKFTNRRVYRDTKYYQFEDTFKNENRSTVYALSPYDETLLVDVDYLVCNNTLNAVWGSVEEVMINSLATGLMHNEMEQAEKTLSPYGIKMYWATVIYFKKGVVAERMFNLVEHIKNHWDYYAALYDMPPELFRNDYAFSIAIHMISGLHGDEYFAPLPIPSIHSAMDFDQLYKMKDVNDLVFFCNDRRETWKFYATRLKGINVHCMNKLSLLNNIEEMMEIMS